MTSAHPSEHGVFYPSDGGTGPAVVVLHGSEGEPRHEWAQMFAKVGVPALAIRWFGKSGIVEVPVETVVDAAEWLGTRTGRPVILAGHSKGAELALITASLGATLLAGVMAWAPSSVAWYGFNPATWDPADARRSSWSWRGVPIAFLYSDARPRMSDRGVVLRSCYERVLEGDPGDAAIAIDNFAGKVFLVSGTDDQMWPSEEMAMQLVDRMSSRPGDILHVSCPGAGHLITPDTAGNAPGGTDMGGTPDADRSAAEQAWEAAIRWLRSLKQ